MRIVLTISIFSLLTTFSFAKRCTLVYSDDEHKYENISNPLDRHVIFQILHTEECWVDTTYMYLFLSAIHDPGGNHTTDTTNSSNNLTIALKFGCPYKTSIHFAAFNSSEGTVIQKWNIVLILDKCSVAVEEVNTILALGRIIMLQFFENPKIFEMDSKCLYAADLELLLIQHSCDTNETYLRKIFWDSCGQMFSKVIILSLKMCLDINVTALQERFPNLYTLTLCNVNLDGVLRFPFNRSRTKSKTKHTAIMNEMKLFFDFMQKLYQYYLFSEESLVLLNCKINQSLLHLSGEGDEIQMSNMALRFMKPDLFRDIVVSTNIDLSNNSLEIIDEDLFKTQSLLKYLYLQNNKLTVLPQNIFKGLKSVLTIDVSGNLIKSVPIDPFRSLFNIQEIGLQNNLIESFPVDMFMDQTNSLRVLYLYSNPLKDIPVWPFYATFLNIYHISNAKLTGKSIITLSDNLNNLNIVEKEVETQLTLPLKSQQKLPLVLLYSNEIETISSANVTGNQINSLLTLMTHFTIDFHGNPLTCNCDTYVVRKSYEIAYLTDGLRFTTLTFDSLRCEYPSELRGRFMWNISETEKYCPVILEYCPKICNCFQRKNTDTIIVDCRDHSFQEMPKVLPPYTLELWFENSNISKVSPWSYFENVTVLNLAKNHIKQISPSVINKLSSARIIYLHSNNLTSLPIQIQSLQLSKLTLSNNPFVCDCTMKWMKTWLLNDEDFIADWIKVQCLETSNNITQLIAVPDSHFVCTPANDFSVGEHVFLPSIIIGSVLFVLLVLSCISYVFRFNIKILLFVFFNIHPFDKIKQKAENSCYDTVLIYVLGDNKFVEVIIKHLSKRRYEIGDIYRNSLIGYSWIENIEKLIACSKSVILYMPEDSINDKIIQAAWNIAYDKLMTSSISSLILVTDKKVQKHTILDESLKLFMRSNHCVDRHSRLLLEKVDYLLSSHASKNKIGDSEMNIVEESIDEESESKRILVSYPDDLHCYVKDKLIPYLSEQNLRIKVLDMVFTVGRDKRDEIPDILDAADFVVFIVNDGVLNDEISMYILTEILTKSKLENHNYLLLCTLGQVCIESMTNELSKYVDNYVTISTNDTEFQNRILESITKLKYRRERREIHDAEMIPLL